MSIKPKKAAKKPTAEQTQIAKLLAAIAEIERKADQSADAAESDAWYALGYIKAVARQAIASQA